MPSETGQLIRAGDAVLHRPSGEKWLVATDEDDGMFYAAGWPETRAHAEHCEIVRTATDEQRLKMLEQAATGRWSPRQSLADYQLRVALYDQETS